MLKIYKNMSFLSSQNIIVDDDENRVKPVQRRLLFPLTIVLLLLVIGANFAFINIQRNHLEKSSQQKLEDASRELTKSLDKQAQALIALEDVLVQEPILREGIKTKNRKLLFARYSDLFNTLRRDFGVTHFYFHLADRVNLLRVHKPEKNGDFIDRFTAREAEQTGKISSGIELGPLGTFTLRVVCPIFDNTQQLIGYLELGKEIEDILWDIHDNLQVELLVTIDKKWVVQEKWESGMEMLKRSHDWGGFRDKVQIYSTFSGLQSELKDIINEKHHIHDEVMLKKDIHDHPWHVLFTPLNDVSGVEVGHLIILNNLSEDNANFNRVLVISTGGTLILLSILLSSLYFILRKTDKGILKQHEEILNSRNRFQRVVENSPGVNFRCQGDRDRTILFISQKIDTISGYSADNFINTTVRTYRKIICSEDIGYVERCINKAIKSKSNWEIEYRIQHRDGDIRWVYEKGIAVFGEENRVEFLDGFILDITQRKEVEFDLRKSETFQRTLLKSSPDFIFVLDKKGIILKVNRFFSNDPDIIGKKVSSFLPSEFCEHFEKCFQRVLTDRQVQSMETKVNLPDGSHYFLFRFNSLDLSENEYSVVLVATDITARKQAEESLTAQKTRLANIIKAANVGTWEWDVQTGDVIFNDRLLEITGYSVDELSPPSIETWLNLLYPEDRAKSNELLKNVFAGELDYYNCEIRIRHKNGDWIWLLSRGNISSWSDNRTPLLMSGIHQDITSSKKAEENLRKTNIRLEKATVYARAMAEKAALANSAKSEFLANMSHEIRTPMNGVLGMINDLLTSTLSPEQRESAEIVQKSANTLMVLINDILDFSKIEAGKLELENIDFDLQDIMDDLIDIESSLIKEEKLEFICAVNPGVQTKLKGDPVRLKQILLNLISNAIKFTASGEISVRTFLESEEETKVILRFEVKDTGIGVTAEQQKHLFRAFTQADKSTTRNYGGTGLGLSISKQLTEKMGGQIGVNSQNNNGSTFHFTVVLEKQSPDEKARSTKQELLEGIKILIVDQNITSREVISRQLQYWGGECDHVATGAVVIPQLLSDYQKKESYQIVVINPHSPVIDGESLGRAISAIPQFDKLKLIMMTSFGQRGDAKKAGEAGYSAYLSKPLKQSLLYSCLVKLLDKKNVGKDIITTGNLITRHSLREENMEEIIKQNMDHQLLLVEDNIVNQKVARNMLAKQGYQVDIANNGHECLKMVKEKRYDLVLMDCQMPVMDGYQATEAIRSTDTGQFDTNIPIIALTANAMRSDRERCFSAGMNDYIAKPIRVKALLDMVQKWIDHITKNREIIDIKEDIIATTDLDTQKERMVFDKNAMMERLMGDQEVAVIVIQAFLEETPQQISSMESSVATADFAGVRLHAHGIKGSAGNIGAEELQQNALEIEKADSDSMLVEKIRELKENYKKLEIILNKEI